MSDMETIYSAGHYVLLAAVFATLGVLAIGVFSMLRGGPFNAKYSNKLMRLRIVFQAVAITVLVLLLFFSQYWKPGH